MAIKRFAGRILVTGDTHIHLENWTDTVSVLIPRDTSGTSHLKTIEIDAYGNVRLMGHTVEQAEIR